MIKDSILGGATAKLAPLISFYTIVDTDIGLMNLIHNEYLDKTVFDETFFDKDFYDKIYSLYRRKEKNPLLVFAKDKSNVELLDSYYKEFIETCESKILSYSITTEILSLIDTFNISQEIVPVILCYSEDQMKILEDEPKLSKNRKVLLSSLSESEKKAFTQYFFRDMEEIEPFKECIAKTFYISSRDINLNDESSDIKDDHIIEVLLKNRNNINIFDMYKKELIGRK